jgi:glycosyltransferase involved in cell wall biosynthesis
MRARRILHCIPGMGGGGAERQLAYLSGELVRRGWDVHVALVSEGPNYDRLRRSGATIHRLRASGNYDPGLLWRLLRTLRRVEPDLVQVWILQMEILGSLAASLRHVPWIFSERCCEEAYPSSLRFRVREWTGARATAIVSNSPGGDDYWRSRSNPAIPRYVIPNALPLDEIAAAKPIDDASAGLSPSDRVILFAARLAEQKNPETLLRALLRLRDRPNVVSVVAGDGPLAAALVDFAKTQGLPVRFPGYLRDLWPWMKRAAVFVSPAFFEGHPNTVMEAAAAGCPLVVSDIPAHRQFLDDRSARIVPARDDERLAAAIAEVLDCPDAARGRAARARTTAQSWSAQRIAGEYERVYLDVLNGAARKER